ncbi:MAG: HAD family hydrolase [Aristaeellaceae bacterium]
MSRFPYDLRLIAVDLDGTLLGRDKAVSPRTLRALHACRSRGIRLAFVTGRSVITAGAFLAQLRPDAAALAYGAHILLQGETVFRRCMPPEVATRVLWGAREATRLRWQPPDGPCCQTDPGPGQLPLDRRAPIRCPAEHLCAWNLPERTARALAAGAGCSLTQVVGDQWCNFSALGVGKGDGMRRIMAMLGIQPGQAVAFGDESCDVAFFRACGWGVAMGNADAVTLACADAVTAANDRDGIALYLEWLLDLPAPL